MNKIISFSLIVFLLLTPSYIKTDTHITFPYISNHPSEMGSDRGKLLDLPKYDPQKPKTPWQVDLRSYDLTELKLKDRYEDLIHADFDSNTKWPLELPENYNPDKIMELGKNPGLGIRQLHKDGITGKGIGIAIIDSVLLVDHAEYKDNLKYYDEMHCLDNKVEMHGPAVASIAVGKSIGVAPSADLYYIAADAMDCINGEYIVDFKYLAQSIDRVLYINKQLPSDKKIRVISISMGWSNQEKGYDEIIAAVNRAKEEGIFVISSSVDETYGFNFNGLGRQPYSDPELASSYEAGTFWADYFFKKKDHTQDIKNLYVPMDSRAIASPTGVNDYTFSKDGGWSWSIPYIAGLYALSCEVKPNITPEEFWNKALSTGDAIKINHEGKEYKLENVINPNRLIDELKKEKK